MNAGIKLLTSMAESGKQFRRISRLLAYLKKGGGMSGFGQAVGDFFTGNWGSIPGDIVGGGGGGGVGDIIGALHLDPIDINAIGTDPQVEEAFKGLMDDNSIPPSVGPNPLPKP